jgi:hypothetical protein
MNYDPTTKTEGGGRAVAGLYSFTVDSVTDKVWKSGNPGAEITLQVGAFEDRSIKVFDRMTYAPSSLWKVQQFLAALGFDFMTPPENNALLGKCGMAKFKVGEKGYLEVDEYLPSSANNGPDDLPL